MLESKNKLKKKADFDRVYEKGKFCSMGMLSLKATPNKEPATRIGFVISKKFSKKAVERNRVRRILRSCAFDLIKDIKEGFDIIILTKSSKIEMNKKIIFPVFLKLLKKSNLLK